MRITESRTLTEECDKMEKRIMIRRLTAFVCLLAMLLSILPMGIFAEETVTQGNCGAEGDSSNMQWSFDESTNTLTISGTGAMKEYKPSDSPWREFVGKVQKLVISDGVTSISDGAFYEFHSIEAVILPDSLQRIGADAFYNCSNLGTAGSVITLPKNLSEIGYGAFAESRLTRDVLSVDSENTHFYMSKGCLIEKAEKRIIYACADAEIPDDIEGLVLGDWSFGDYAMSRLVIPSNVVKVEACACLCSYIFDIYFESSDVEIIDDEWTISSTAVIHGAKGSTAEKYAEKYNRLFGGFNDSFRRRGYCGAEGDGTGVQWTIDTDAGSLIITGNGKMKEYSRFYDVPWGDYKSVINNIYISEGIESISEHTYIYQCDIYIENPDMLITAPGFVYTFGRGSRIHGYKGSTAEKFVKEANDEYGEQFGGDFYEFVLLTAHEHDYGSEWKSDSAKHWHECKICHNIIDETDHNWDNGKVTKELTEDADGEKLFTCSDCKTTKTEKIEKLSAGRQTGLQTGLLIGITVAVILAAALVAVFLIIKRKQRKTEG